MADRASRLCRQPARRQNGSQRAARPRRALRPQARGVVGDRGMVTSHNLDELRDGGHGYIVGRNRRRSGEVFDYIQSATRPWIECRPGITVREKAEPPKTLVQEVAAN